MRWMADLLAVFVHGRHNCECSYGGIDADRFRDAVPSRCLGNLQTRVHHYAVYPEDGTA